MAVKNFNHVFTIIDNMVAEAVSDMKEDGEHVSCRKGCSHCCHLIVEVSWEEASEVARWIMDQEPEKRSGILAKLEASTQGAKDFFAERGASRYASSFDEDEIEEIPDDLCDEYFYSKKRPCAFLENDVCSAYEVRPTPCRLHMVTGDPYDCSFEAGETGDFEIPGRVEELQEETGPVMIAMEKDNRRGHLPIMVSEVLEKVYAVTADVPLAANGG